MAYEVDFVNSTKVEKDYDAIAFRYWSSSENRWIVCVFDGGTEDAGESLSEHIERFYLKDRGEIDFVFCSHPDLDHASGLKCILRKYKVKNLVMNRPWLYLDELYDKVKDGRITKESLERGLREKYKFVDDLEKMANEQEKCQILSGLTGVYLSQEMAITSPTKAFYIQCIVDSDKTPEMGDSNKKVSPMSNAFKSVIHQAKKWLQAIWGQDDIREGETTSAENESSIVLRVHPNGDEPFLLLGDVGCEGLNEAMNFADKNCIPLDECTFVQIPHHGGRHNVSPSLLNRLIGMKVAKGATPTKVAFVSVGKDSDHPRKCVVNAFLNRGCKVFVARKNSLYHHCGDVPSRGWSPAVAEPFSDTVESWDE